MTIEKFLDDYAQLKLKQKTTGLTKEENERYLELQKEMPGKELPEYQEDILNNFNTLN